ncbi:hypothetical protein M8R20_08360 [Pseudomonas sp. R2.Fl]|nr:hypothetical protein [Pseudomonas sp. R2.Fl]
MTTLRTILGDAVNDGVITSGQAQPLEDFLAKHGVSVMPVSNAVHTPSDEAEDAAFETEAPRFIRGFHDVLITIGVLIVIAGAWGIASLFAVLPLVLVLSEILVRRQRLALPAVVLSIATGLWGIFAVMLSLELLEVKFGPVTTILLLLSPLPPIMGAYYWRYRVPIALSILLLSVFAFLLTVVIYGLGVLTGVPNFVVVYPFWSAVIFLASAVALFCVALRFDFSDPVRQTRRSDIAFWLHLASAPALLYAMLSFLFLREGNGLFSLDSVKATENAAIVLVVVAILILIGLVIDRRAFVTAGLVSLITAVVTILGRNDFGGGGVVFVAMLLVGSMVLSIGVGWPQLRRLAVGGLPDGLKTKLPPLR